MVELDVKDHSFKIKENVLFVQLAQLGLENNVLLKEKHN
jgi:hypothetical protein